MNATPHTVLGYAAVATLYVENPLTLFIGFYVAFISHLILDYIGESNGIKTTNQRLYLDVLPTLVLASICGIVGGWTELGLFIVGSIGGNLPDLIDKKLYLSIIYPNKYKSTEYLHWQKPIINPPGWFTKSIGWILAFIASLILLV